MKKQNYLIHVTGPTCSGKTSLAIVLGEFFKTEIISFDSRQFYKKMNIGTSVPNKMELKKCKHHFIQHKKITDNYNIGDYRKDTLELLKKLVVSVKYPEKIISVIKYFYKKKKFNSIVKIE